MNGSALEVFLRRRGVDTAKRLVRTGKTFYVPPESIAFSGWFFQAVSRADQFVTVHPFLNVLSVGRGYRSLSYGKQVRTLAGGEAFDLGDPIQVEELIWLLEESLLPEAEAASTVEGAIAHILKPRLLSGGLYRFVDLAHLYLWLGHTDEALDCLQNVIWEAELGGHRVQWVADLGARCLRLYRQIHWDRSRALDDIKDWALGSACRFKLVLAQENAILPRRRS